MGITVSIAVAALCMTLSRPQYNDTYISKEIQEVCIEVGDEYWICPELLIAIIERESSGIQDAENGSCKGLMQIDEGYHKERMENLGVTDIYDIEGNIRVGADYIAELEDMADGDIYLVLMLYSMDHKRAYKDYNLGRYTKYATGITERSIELERLHGK